MNTADFDYDLPSELIAQHPPVDGRDQSRLMVLNRENQRIEHRHFFELPQLLQPGDVVVMNNSKVFPARLLGTKKETGGQMEVFLLRRIGSNSGEEEWEGMVRGRHIHDGQVVNFSEDFSARVGEALSEKTRKIFFAYDEQTMQQQLDAYGKTPIPPYIKENTFSEDQLRQEYQTVYAKKEGSAAAPTAGLHFTEQLLQQLRDRDITIAEVTLHVGLGTFAPVKSEQIEAHTMHKEFATITKETAAVVNTAKAEGRRIIAVGTTTVRTLESFMRNGVLEPGDMWTDIFINPGYQFQCIDGMITNFHLPQSTLLMLVSAFAGTELTKTAYSEAVREQYRFYSFGDAMLIL